MAWDIMTGAVGARERKDLETAKSHTWKIRPTFVRQG